jgi:type IV pilus assembly protein PilE
MRVRMQGVTLIELVIVVVIIGILASIAVPTYSQYVLRSHRVEAKSALMKLAAAQEQYYVQNNTYATAAKLSTAPPGGLGIPATTENGWYTIAIADGASTAAYSATATAAGSQTRDTKCASFTINQLGQKTATNSGGSDATDECWLKK